MVKLAGPCLSLDASGSIAGTLTFSKWRGRQYARQLVTPANPKTAMQVAMRAMFKFLSQEWAGIGSIPKASWDAPAAVDNILAFNAFVKDNCQAWRQFGAPAQTYPNAGTGTLPVLTLDSATGGVAHIDLTFTVTTMNGLWGVMIFRSPTGTFATALSNCIAVIPVTGTGTLVWTDSPLEPGTYYYDARAFTTEGNLGPEEGEVNATAT